jgi:hypothetical protein
VRVVAVRYRVQDRDEGDRHRLGEVEQTGSLVEDGLGVAEVGDDVLVGTIMSALVGLTYGDLVPVMIACAGTASGLAAYLN